MLVSDFQGARLVFQSLLCVLTGWKMQWVKSRSQLVIQLCSNSHEKMLTQVDIVANYRYLDGHVDRKLDYKASLPRKLGCRCGLEWLLFLCWAAGWRNSWGDLHPGGSLCRGCWEDSAVWMSHTPARQHLQPKTDHTECCRSFLHFATSTVHFLLYLV